MGLSIRLQAVADLVTAGYSLADIGTDHAFLPISLIEEGKIPSAIAMDVNKGPLETARAHVVECGMHDRIQLRMSDGFSAMKPGETQSAVIAGMGGALVIRILREGAEVVRSLRECILQPQSELDKVRAFLLEEGFFFLAEDMVKDDGKYYPMMKVAPPGAWIPGEHGTDEGYGTRENQLEKLCMKASMKESMEEFMEEPMKASTITWSRTELKYGRLLLQQKNAVLREYLQREIRIKQEILSGMEGMDSESVNQRRTVLLEELAQAKEAAQCYV